MIDIRKVYSFNFPTLVRFGPGVIKELGSYLKDNNLSSPLLVTDPILQNLNFLKKFKRI